MDDILIIPIVYYIICELTKLAR